MLSPVYLNAEGLSNAGRRYTSFLSTECRATTPLMRWPLWSSTKSVMRSRSSKNMFFISFHVNVFFIKKLVVGRSGRVEGNPTSFLSSSSMPCLIHDTVSCVALRVKAETSLHRSWRVRVLHDSLSGSATIFALCRVSRCSTRPTGWSASLCSFYSLNKP